jgi:hypothetical protein
MEWSQPKYKGCLQVSGNGIRSTLIVETLEVKGKQNDIKATHILQICTSTGYKSI